MDEADEWSCAVDEGWRRAGGRCLYGNRGGGQLPGKSLFVARAKQARNTKGQTAGNARCNKTHK